MTIGIVSMLVRIRIGRHNDADPQHLIFYNKESKINRKGCANGIVNL
jgi:hypothetical protein